MSDLSMTRSSIDIASEVFRRHSSENRPQRRSGSKSAIASSSASVDPVKALVAQILGRPVQPVPTDLSSDLATLKKFASMLVDAKNDGTLTNAEASKLLEVFVEGFAHRRINDALANIVLDDEDDYISWFYATAKSSSVR